MIGEVLGERYELLEKIGEGGMAIVYKARDRKLDRLVAVKILKKEFANNKDVAEKFKKEATAVANFSNSNIVNVLDVGHEEDGNVDYFVMEYINGKTLKEFIKYNGKLTYTTAINIAIKIAKALECAHGNNIIHRDVKPQNILVTESGEVKVTDFGIAKSSTSSTITNTTTIMGSAHYLSPEQAKGSFIDFRSDIYSLGIVLYEMVTGKLPFDGESPVTVALKHIQEEPIEPKAINASIPNSLNALIMKCINKEPINRYESCRELIKDLQTIKDNPDVNLNTAIDDGRTIIMEPIKVDNKQNISKPNIYTKADFEKDYSGESEEESDDKNEKNRQIPSNKKISKKLIIGIVITLLLLVGGIVGAVVLGSNNATTAEIPVPNIIGMDVEVAKKKLEELGLKLEIVGTSESDRPENSVLESIPEASAMVDKGSTVKVTISGGEEKVKVPDLRDYEVNYIKEVLTRLGLKYEITEEYSDVVEQGYLISQNPEKNTEVVKDTVIKLTISSGPEVKIVLIENYLGENIEEAQRKLEDLGLVVQVVEQETDRESENGIVIQQSLQRGNKVGVGTPITLTYGKYVDPTVDVSQYIYIGMNLSDAIAVLDGANISYTISGGSPSQESMNTYTIKGFTENIKKGELVKLQIEKIPQTPSGDNNSNNGNDAESGNNGNGGNGGNSADNGGDNNSAEVPNP